MKDKLNRLSEQYLAALRKHLKPGPKASAQPAIRLGRQAAALGLETMELARIHEQALTTLAAPGGSARTRERTLQRAKTFLAEAIAPIEQTHRAALVADDRMNQLNQTLCQRTVELTASTQHLQQDIIQHQAAEKALQKSGKHRTQLLAESHRLQEHLRHLTHKILSAQEQERETISHQLQDEIVQILLGINVRLLALKTAAKGNTANLKKEIASTQRLVEESVQSINRFARELDIHQPP